MSELTEKLDFILDWLKSINPDPKLYDFDCYNQGLYHQEIDRITSSLPFKLSQDLYDLFQWRNGMDTVQYFGSDSFLFPEQLFSGQTILFSGLQASVGFYHHLREISQEYKDYGTNHFLHWDKKFFPIAFSDLGDVQRKLYVIGDLNSSPVYLRDLDGAYNPVEERVYKNLTSMVSVIAECCEMGLYELMPYEYGKEGEMEMRINPEKLDAEKVVYQKYNS